MRGHISSSACPGHVRHSARGRSARRRLLATALAAGLIGSLVAVPPATARPRAATPPAVRPDRSVPVTPVPVTAKPMLEVDKRAQRGSPAVTWPQAGTAEVTLPAESAPAARTAARAAGTMVQAGALPVWVGSTPAQPATGARASSPKTSAPERVRVELLDRATAQRTGMDGPVLRLTRTDGGTGPGTVAVAVDYSGFRAAFGGNWASRLHLVSLPDCAVSTPEKPACRGTAVRSANAPAQGRLSAEVTLPAGGAGTRSSAAAGESAQLLGVTAGPKGVGGNFTATSLSPSATWSAGGSTGDFSWSYPITVPPALGAAAPQITLGYSSSNVDGRTSAANNQSSWVGTGFDFWPGFVERRYRGCAEDGNETGDLCWFGKDGNITIALNGKASQVVHDDGGKGWRFKDDDGSRIEQLSGTANGAEGGEHWRVTTTDGTQYYFGLNRPAGWTGDKEQTESAWTVPVAGNNAGERCHNSTFAKAFCDQAWRLNLDHVVDVHGNTVTYYYGKEFNSYGRNKATAEGRYVRGGWLKRVDYGQRAGQTYSSPALARVRFDVAPRCVDQNLCDFAHRENFPDVPLDQRCDGGKCEKNLSPTFWTTNRLAKITTEVRSGADYRPVDSWTLRHTYPQAWDKTTPSMWLAGITRTGLTGPTPIVLPEVVFEGQELTNRVGTGTFAEPMVWWRMKTIFNEYGGGLTVKYSDPDCGPKDVPAPEDNHRLCYPTYWKPDHYPDVVQDWFRKYLVQEVSAFDRVAAATTTTTKYEYVGRPAWHYDEIDGMGDPAHKTWSQWRGYERVKTFKGTGSDGAQTESEALYMRGMDGDRKNAAGGTRPATVKDSDGVEIVDRAPLQGFLREEISRKGRGGPVVSRTVNDPWVSDPTATAKHPWGTTEAHLVDTASVRNFTALSDGGWRKTRIDKKFDGNGIVQQINDLGDVETGNDDTCTSLTYAGNASRWLLNVPYRSETVAVACGKEVSRPDDVISDVRTYFDGSDVLGAAPDKGDATRVEELLEYRDDKPYYVTRSKVTHDEYGRMKTSTDTNGKTTTTEYTPATGGPVTAVKVINPLKHATTTTLDPHRGLSLSQTDANGRRTTMEYDGLGRLVKGWLPGRSGSPSAEFSYEVSTDKPIVVQTRALAANGTYIATFEILDGLLRSRQKQMPAPGGGRILTDTFYDSRGLTTHTYGAYFNKDAPPGGDLRTASTDTEVPGHTVTVYDGAAQPTEKIFKSGGVKKWHTRLDYLGDRVSSTPPKGGTATTTITDARGRTTELRQYHAATPTGEYDKTQYRYNRKGQLSDIIDPANNVWHYEYDLAGRMVESRDPDKGTSKLAYNEANQLITSTDSLGNTLAFGYDALGRQTEVREGTASGKLRTKTEYDTLPGGLGLPTAATRFVGDKAYVTGVTGYEVESGRPNGQYVTIPAGEGELAKTYSFTAKYNIDGSLRSSTAPGAGGLPAETLEYGYNGLNLPTTLSGLTNYVTESLYTKFSEPARYTLHTGLGSGTQPVWLNFDYQDGTRRLDHTAVTRTEEPANVADVNYKYDDAGNITKIADVPQSRPSDVQCFDYDHLRRLTEAWTPKDGDCEANRSAAKLGGAAPYWTSYRYDVTGNRTTLTDHTTTGDVIKKYDFPDPGKPHPHALTKVTAGSKVESFTYDAAGNTKTRTIDGSTQTLNWDPEGRLAETIEGGKRTSYVYDAGGNRLLRRDPTGTTLYLPGMELKVDASGKNVVGTRYYSHNGTTVASRTGTQLTWLAGDHQGTARIALKEQDQAISQRYQTPFGESRGTPVGWANEKGFVGGTVDAATGLTHLGARQYDAANGRFISVDPVIDPLDPQQLNGYAYANNTPVTQSDPSGLLSADSAERWAQNGWDIGIVGGQISATGRQRPQPNTPPQQQIEQARQISKRSTMDLIVDVGGEVLKELLGVNDFVDCFTKGSVMGCVNTAMNVIPWGQLGKIPKIAKAIKMVWEAVTNFKRQLAWAKAILRQADDAAVAAQRAAAETAQQVTAHADDGAKAAERGAEAIAKKADGAGSSCKKHSFDPNTRVVMADGARKKIKHVKVGDKVKATDPKTGRTTVRRVTKLHLNLDTDLVDLKVRTGDGRTKTIRTTSHHPFWDDTTGKWTPAGALVAGHALRSTTGETVTVRSVHAYTGLKVMNDLTVATTHTYYVIAGNTPVLVHNCGGSVPDHPEACACGGGGIDPALVRFSQDEVSATFSNGNTIEQTAAGLRSGYVKPSDIPVVRLFVHEGALHALDNRRLAAFQKAGVTMPFRMATADEVMNESWKLTTKNGGTSIMINKRDPEVWRP